MKRTRTLAALMVGSMLILLLVACGGGDDDSTVADGGDTTTATTSTPTSEPTDVTTEETATNEPDQPTTTVTREEPTATATNNDAVATSEPTGERLVGSASVEDDADDVVNLLMQEPDEPMPGIDLITVRLEGDGSRMQVTIETAGDIGADLNDDITLSYDVHLWQGDKPTYALSFHFDDADGWEAVVTDFSVGILGDEETVDTEIAVSGNSLSASFPVSMLPDLDDSFEWYASVMQSRGGMPIGPDAWFDGAPENVIQLLADPDEFVEFPQ